MATFDTNVVVRLIVEDDEEQSRQAERAWRASLASEGIFLPTVVLVETAWVLRTAYQFGRDAIASTLLRLMEIEKVTIENGVEVRRALSRYRAGAAEFSDYLILETARTANSLPVRTFDRTLTREAGVVGVDVSSPKGP